MEPIHKDLKKLEGADATRRIFSQVSYAAVRTVQIVPVVHPEALEIGAWFPVVWKQVEGGVSLVALRSLLEDGTGQPAGSPQHPASLPLLLKAYPFAPAPVAGSDPDEIWFEDIFADAPTDVGSSILNDRGLQNRGTEQRQHSLKLYQANLGMTQTLSDYLWSRGALVPWPLDLDASGTWVKVEGLFVVKSELYDSPFMVRFVREFGLLGARLVSAHSISLFRAGVLFQRARRVLAERMNQRA
ncbi:SapC family protein [Micromonospora sp. STR1s_5]|nr:SapC family protein [Micromonospora sp. STR1s_5]